MNVGIYVSATNPTKYVSVPTGGDVRALNLPSDSVLSTLNPFRLDADIFAGNSYGSLSADDMLGQIGA